MLLGSPFIHPRSISLTSIGPPQSTKTSQVQHPTPILRILHKFTDLSRKIFPFPTNQSIINEQSKSKTPPLHCVLPLSIYSTYKTTHPPHSLQSILLLSRLPPPQAQPLTNEPKLPIEISFQFPSLTSVPKYPAQRKKKNTGTVDKGKNKKKKKSEVKVSK